jgi:hypothetical protein
MLQTKETLRNILDTTVSTDEKGSQPITIRINGSDPIPLDIAAVKNGDALELNVTICHEASKVPLSHSRLGDTLSVLSGNAGVNGQAGVNGYIPIQEAVYLTRLGKNGAIPSEVIFMTPGEAVQVAIDLLGSAMQTQVLEANRAKNHWRIGNTE